jgi:hypothetical protein
LYSPCAAWAALSTRTGGSKQLLPLLLLLLLLLPLTGDVNFFFNDHEDRSIAEIEIMIAEPASRRRGIATEALMLFMAYGVSALGVTRFRAKIGEDNVSSLQLFAKLGYSEVSRSAVFQEVTLELAVEGDAKERLTAAAQQLQLGTYDGDGDA